MQKAPELKQNIYNTFILALYGRREAALPSSASCVVAPRGLSTSSSSGNSNIFGVSGFFTGIKEMTSFDPQWTVVPQWCRPALDAIMSRMTVSPHAYLYLYLAVTVLMQVVLPTAMLNAWLRDDITSTFSKLFSPAGGGTWLRLVQGLVGTYCWIYCTTQVRRASRGWRRRGSGGGKRGERRGREGAGQEESREKVSEKRRA